MRIQIYLLHTMTAALVILGMCTNTVSAQSARQLLKEGVYYHDLDDITDRAAERYRLILSRYPNSREAEQAQYYLGTYFLRKFDILEARNRVRDWSSLNQAEAALHTYVETYTKKPKHWYLSDAYHALAMSALRRGQDDDAVNYLDKLTAASRLDKGVYVSWFLWSPTREDKLGVDCDSKKLASATVRTTREVKSFSDRVRALTDWCRTKCAKTLFRD